jgi:two-component system sensor histidine kinase HydH
MTASGGPSATGVADDKRDLLARLLGRLAHEIRNPLSSLNIHLQLLQEDLESGAAAPKEQLTSRLEIIHGEMHRLESIVERFLRLASPSQIDPEPVDVGRIVRQVIELLEPEAGNRGVSLRASVPPVPLVTGDPVRLMQALLNLVINAVQAHQQPGTVDVRVESLPEGLRLEVVDDGPGLAADKLPSIFEPYYTTKPEGHGLGLWIAHQIIKAHGGVLRAGNAPGRGAVFTIELPFSPHPG